MSAVKESQVVAPDVYVHPTAVIDEPVTIGAGTKIWHFCHVMSGATIEDARTDITFTGNYFFDRARTALAIGYSGGNDYQAINGGLDGELSFNDKSTTLSAGGSFSFDTIEPTPDPLFPACDRTTPAYVIP